MEEAWNKKGCFVVKDVSSWVSAHGKMWTRLSQNATTEGTHRGWEYEPRLSQWNIALDHYGEGIRDSKTTAARERACWGEVSWWCAGAFVRGYGTTPQINTTGLECWVGGGGEEGTHRRQNKRGI